MCILKLSVSVCMGFLSGRTSGSPILVPSLGLFSLFVLSNSDELVFLSSHYHPLEACLFLNQRKKGSRSGWKGKWRRPGRSRGRGNIGGKKSPLSIRGGGRVVEIPHPDCRDTAPEPRELGSVTELGLKASNLIR